MPSARKPVTNSAPSQATALVGGAGPWTTPTAGWLAVGADGIGLVTIVVPRGLQPVHLGVRAAGRHQLVVGAHLHDTPLLQADDPVGQARGPEPVRDQQDRLAGRELDEAPV